MSETLYRKYRPKKFDEVIGQEQVVSVLKNALKNDTVAHAYIFAGSRGIGKTSIARIFAEALGVSQNDLYEIDAASNRGIDDIRAIKDAVSTLPFDSRYKVYIVDEAHMLTKEAWNALLKTLEEPPSHVLFILATTEIEKIPDTILSRCEMHVFKKPDQATLKEMIKHTAKKEGLSIEDEAIEVLALIADGSFRDAHGALQKIISSSEGGKVTLADVEQISGAPKVGLVHDLIDALSEKDVSKGINVVVTLRKENRDVKAFMKLLLEKVRAVLFVRLGGEFAEGVEKTASKDHFAFLKAHADKKSITSETLITLLDAYERASRSSFPDTALEASLLHLFRD
ncbi:MAG: DNA polymerase III subunit gamma/tau [Candidatus Paceibacterota bacterium]|jgi:DNA polymerase-3 subunit gamma/tau